MPPLYQYKCPNCGRQQEDIRCVADRQDAPQCHRCKQQTILLISPVAGVVKNPAVPRSKPC